MGNIPQDPSSFMNMSEFPLQQSQFSPIRWPPQTVVGSGTEENDEVLSSCIPVPPKILPTTGFLSAFQPPSSDPPASNEGGWHGQTGFQAFPTPSNRLVSFQQQSPPGLNLATPRRREGVAPWRLDGVGTVGPASVLPGRTVAFSSSSPTGLEVAARSASPSLGHPPAETIMAHSSSSSTTILLGRPSARTAAILGRSTTALDDEVMEPFERDNGDDNLGKKGLQIAASSD
jgi:hypothetical protein